MSKGLHIRRTQVRFHAHLPEDMPGRPVTVTGSVIKRPHSNSRGATEPLRRPRMTCTTKHCIRRIASNRTSDEIGMETRPFGRSG